jgi:trigger factor
MFADVRRGLTIAAAVDAATVTDTDGNVVDTTEFFGKRDQLEAADDGETDEADDGDEHAEAVEATVSSEESPGDPK